MFNRDEKEITSKIISCSFGVLNELGIGYLEGVYKKSLILALEHAGLSVEVEKSFEIYFRGEKVGLYRSDLIVNNCVLIELKCCKALLLEHKAQVINYLRCTNLPIGLLINFANRKLEYNRLYNPNLSVISYPASP
jgi:GxxExxY protein